MSNEEVSFITVEVNDVVDPETGEVRPVFGRMKDKDGNVILTDDEELDKEIGHLTVEQQRLIRERIAAVKGEYA